MSLSIGGTLSSLMFFCLLRLGSRLPPHPVIGQSAMLPSEAVTALGHFIAIFVSPAFFFLVVFLADFLVGCAPDPCASIVTSRTKMKTIGIKRRGSRYRFMEAPFKNCYRDKLRGCPTN